jgi:hypothetical protein
MCHPVFSTKEFETAERGGEEAERSREAEFRLQEYWSYRGMDWRGAIPGASRTIASYERILQLLTPEF